MRKQKNAIRRASLVIKENRLILFGALVMLAWTLWEGAVRYEAVDGVTKAYFGLVREGDITLRRALENLWNTLEARSDLLSFVYLALTAVFSVVCLFLRKKWKAGFAIIPLCALVLAYRPATNPILRALNLFELIKDVSAVSVALGAAVNIVSAFPRRKKKTPVKQLSGNKAYEWEIKSVPAPKKDRFGSPRTHVPRRTEHGKTDGKRSRG